MRLSDQEMAAYLADCRAMTLDEIRKIIPVDTPSAPILYDLMLDYPLREAKALRPALCLATCRAFGGFTQAALPTAAVLELYHNAFLIHDDVEDDSERRRGRSTLHRRYGTPIAVNVGDALLALTLYPLLGNMERVGMGRALRVLSTIADMARVSAVGQAIELDWIRRGGWDISDDDYIDMVRKKTARYTFEAPIELGAILAGAFDARVINALTEFAGDLGVAFQIQDDLLNLRGEEREYGKEICGDLWEGKRTLILLCALRRATPAERERAVGVLNKVRPSSVTRSGPLPGSDDAVGHHDLIGMIADLRADGDMTPKAHDAILTLISSRAGKSNSKTQGDIDFLMDLIRRTEAMPYADAIAARHAKAALARFDSLRPEMAEGIHQDFVSSVVHFVVERGW